MTGPELKAALRSLGVSQRWLARRCGLNHMTVSRWCRGILPVPGYAAFAIDLLRRLPPGELRKVTMEE